MVALQQPGISRPLSLFRRVSIGKFWICRASLTCTSQGARALSTMVVSSHFVSLKLVSKEFTYHDSIVQLRMSLHTTHSLNGNACAYSELSPYNLCTVRQNCSSSPSAKLISSLVKLRWQRILQLRTKCRQHSRCSLPITPYSDGTEYTVTQFLCWSAVKPENPVLILRGIQPMSVGTWNLSIVPCILSHTSFLDKSRISWEHHNFFVKCFAEPTKIFCMGSINILTRSNKAALAKHCTLAGSACES